MMIIKRDRMRCNQRAATNERFYESGGVCPQTVLCEFASASPARTFVSPRLHKAAGTLYAMWGQCVPC